MKKMSDHEKHAKMGVLHHLKQVAEDMMKDHMDGGGMKKVSVMSDSPEGLAEGLDKAKDLVGHADMPEGDPITGQHPGGLMHGDISRPGMSTHGAGIAQEDSLDDGGAYADDDEDVDSADESAEHDSGGESDDMPEEHMEPHHIDAKIKHLMDLKKRKMGQS